MENKPNQKAPMVGTPKSTAGPKCHECGRPATHTVHHGKDYPVCEGHANAYMNTVGKEVAEKTHGKRS